MSAARGKDIIRYQDVSRVCVWCLLQDFTPLLGDVLIVLHVLWSVEKLFNLMLYVCHLL